MAISLRLSEKDAAIIKGYAKLHGLTVSELVRRSVFERIEDELDLEAYEKALADYQKDPVNYSIEEVERELGL